MLLPCCPTELDEHTRKLDESTGLPHLLRRNAYWTGQLPCPGSLGYPILLAAMILTELKEMSADQLCQIMVLIFNL